MLFLWQRGNKNVIDTPTISDIIKVIDNSVHITRR